MALVAVVAAGVLIQPVLASSGLVDFDDHWLAAGCTSSGGTKTVMTDYGPAVDLSGRSRGAELYCNVDADSYHNLLQLWAEDDSPNGQVTATVYREDVTAGALSAPEALISASTVDTAGPQVVSIFDEPENLGDMNEFTYMCYVVVSMERFGPGANPRVYSTSLRDVL